MELLRKDFVFRTALLRILQYNLLIKEKKENKFFLYNFQVLIDIFIVYKQVFIFCISLTGFWFCFFACLVYVID